MKSDSVLVPFIIENTVEKSFNVKSEPDGDPLFFDENTVENAFNVESEVLHSEANSPINKIFIKDEPSPAYLVSNSVVNCFQNVCCTVLIFNMLI